jgi:hypothetical protein
VLKKTEMLMLRKDRVKVRNSEAMSLEWLGVLLVTMALSMSLFKRFNNMKRL